jgi:hypothetical protein
MQMTNALHELLRCAENDDGDGGVHSIPIADLTRLHIVLGDFKAMTSDELHELRNRVNMLSKHMQSVQRLIVDELHSRIVRKRIAP